MSAFEHGAHLERNETQELNESRETLEEALGTNTAQLAKKGLEARGALDTVAQEHPEKAEEIAALRKKLSALISDAQDTLEKLAATTALSSTLADLVPSEPKEEQEAKSPISAEELVENPELAKKLLLGIAEVGDHAAPDELLNHSLANEAKEMLKEVESKGGKKYKIALTVAERIFKIILDANTFGFGGAAYDTIKDVLKAFKNRQTQAA